MSILSAKLTVVAVVSMLLIAKDAVFVRAGYGAGVTVWSSEAAAMLGVGSWRFVEGDRATVSDRIRWPIGRYERPTHCEYLQAMRLAARTPNLRASGSCVASRRPVRSPRECCGGR
jgi:hypothetical protein